MGDTGDLSGVWRRNDGGTWDCGVRLVLDRGGPRVFMIYPDGFVLELGRGFVPMYHGRVG